VCHCAIWLGQDALISSSSAMMELQHYGANFGCFLLNPQSNMHHVPSKKSVIAQEAQRLQQRVGFT